MPRKYPRIGNRYKINHPQGLCVICNRPKADARIDIQVNWFRGDDEVAKVHWACIKGMKSDELLAKLTKSWQ